MSSTGTPAITKPKKLTVSLAYSGLIYLPVYVAQKLELFGDLEVELVFSNGDNNAIRQLLHSFNTNPVNNETKEADIAICDPFVIVDEIAENRNDPFSTLSQPYIIGTLIDKPPVWIYREYDDKYNSDSDFTSIANHDSKILGDKLENIEFKKIKNVYTYPAPNTGFFFGIDFIQRSINKEKHVINVSELDFNPLQCTKGETGDIIITSNIVKIAYDIFLHEKTFSATKQPLKTLYTYSTGNPLDKLCNFLFTAILTNKECFKKKKGELIQFLDGLNKAMQLLKKEEYQPEQKKLITHFIKEELKKYTHIGCNHQNETDKEKIAEIILKLISENKCDIYPENTDVNSTLYGKTLKIREKIIPTQSKLYFSQVARRQLAIKAKRGKNHVLSFLHTCYENIFSKGVLKWFINNKEYTSFNYPEIFMLRNSALFLGLFIFLYHLTTTKFTLKSAFKDEYFAIGSVGILIFVTLYFLGINLKRRNQKSKRFVSSPVILVSIISTLYITGAGGKILSNLFSRKSTQTPSKTNIIIDKDTISVDSTKTIRIKVE